MPERLRTHHIEYYKKYIEEEKNNLGLSLKERLMECLDIFYLVGTDDEQKDFFQAHERTLKAVKNGEYIDIGERPDIICNNCINLQCKDSAILRKQLKGWGDHFYAVQQIIEEINKTPYNLTNAQDRLKINSYTSRRSPKLLTDL